MKSQQRVENRQRPVRDAKAFTDLGQRAEKVPFVDGGRGIRARRARSRHRFAQLSLRGDLGERRRTAPEGVVARCVSMSAFSFSGERKQPPNGGPTLTGDSGRGIRIRARRNEGSQVGSPLGGLFFVPSIRCPFRLGVAFQPAEAACSVPGSHREPVPRRLTGPLRARGSAPRGPAIRLREKRGTRPRLSRS